MATTETTSARVDSWLWAVRVFKSRSQATAAVKAGHVRVNGERAKPATNVRVGDRVVVRGGLVERILVVEKVLVKRVSAPLAAQAVIDQSPPPPPKELAVRVAVRDRGAGRPTKRERRDIDRLRGRG
ncbi:RNA-binding S4 domain-containing protein [Cellulosimicrobium composti]|uniref:RNA-binding S4 domain-containing protein n=1 Tax=Cellulosimicrobium composti TaxID=2672572 RepID=A0A6N7ZKM0_9MICO|nr:S4 domain-containing protein [Cellulosimicrobium composti]MTG90055.1 RNA-binding S4 domain-containing protein [Cellulosimicrobium composti]NDO90434.1 RNA-binding S4 domain-containing protein [Cellulosimicrobium composti]